MDGSILPGFGYQRAEGTGLDGMRHAMDSAYLLAGGRLGVNLGYAFPGVRLGLRATGYFGPTLGGGGLAYTGLNALFVYSIGPTFSFRPATYAPIELEAEVAYASQEWLGGQAAIAAPDNIYPLGVRQHGALAGGRILWRPSGWDSLWAVSTGFNLMFGYATEGNTNVFGFTTSGEVGLVLGY